MRAMTLILFMALGTSMALAKPPLREVGEIDGALFDVALANEIRKNCSGISGRLAKGYRYLLSLERRAKELGYSKTEIDSYRNSDTEKARMRAQGDRWLAARGVDKAQEADWCRVGREEIDKGSRIGGLLRVN